MSILSWFFSLVGILGIIGLLTAVPSGIILLVVASNKQDELDKKSLKKKGRLLIIFPFLLIGVSLIFSVALNISSYLIEN